MALRAGHQRRRGGLPLSAARPGVAARHLPLRYCHLNAPSYRPGRSRPRSCPAASRGRPRVGPCGPHVIHAGCSGLAVREQVPQHCPDAAVIGVPVLWLGVGEPDAARSAQACAIRRAERRKGQLEHQRVPKGGLKVEQVSIQKIPVIVRVARARRRTTPGIAPSTLELNSSRHRAHSPASAAATLAVTRTPSLTSSSWTSSSRSLPSGTLTSPAPSSAGAGTVRVSRRAEADPSVRVSKTSGPRGSDLGFLLDLA